MAGLGQRFAAGVDDAIGAMRGKGIRLAGMMADSIFSSDGVYPGEPGLLSEAVASVRAAGGVYIADEVQPGFGRTGGTMWGFQRHGIVPDIVIMGKPMGNGFPIGGVAAKPEVLEAFGSASGYFNTFGGNPVACAAGLAVLDVLAEDNLQHNARQTGAYLLSRLQALSAGHARVGDVRGAGLYIGIEFVRDAASREPDQPVATRAVNAMRERNVLIGTAGKHGNILKIRPPLCFGREHADLLAGAFHNVLAALA